MVDPLPDDGEPVTIIPLPQQEIVLAVRLKLRDGRRKIIRFLAGESAEVIDCWCVTLAQCPDVAEAKVVRVRRKDGGQ
jgi:hypothetical protein